MSAAKLRSPREISGNSEEKKIRLSDLSAASAASSSRADGWAQVGTSRLSEQEENNRGDTNVFAAFNDPEARSRGGEIGLGRFVFFVSKKRRRTNSYRRAC